MNERYKILFESVEIGPKVAKNRFYQVPHAMGSGNDMPNTRAAQRGIKAEGGWGVVKIQVIAQFILQAMTGHFLLQDCGQKKTLPLMFLWWKLFMSMMLLLALSFFMVVPTQQTDTLECRPFHPLEYNKK